MLFSQDIIKLAPIYERSVSGRATISSLLDKYRNSSDKEIIFDFTEVFFVSRSCAQQLILERNQFKARKVNLLFVNLEPQVSKLFAVAERATDRVKIELTVKKFESQEDLSEFLHNF